MVEDDDGDESLVTVVVVEVAGVGVGNALFSPTDSTRPALPPLLLTPFFPFK